MREQKYLDDIQEIKEMMSRSTRFVSLSGLSGISAGVVALLGAGWTYWLWRHPDYQGFDASLQYEIAIAALVTLLLAGLSAVFFTYRRIRGQQLDLWSPYARRVLFNLAIPLAAGGWLAGVLLFRGGLIYVAPMTLIFYGLALINASHYTLPEVRSMGFVQLLLGCVGLLFLGYGLLFWAVGFGVVHIIYGILMYNKYER